MEPASVAAISTIDESPSSDMSVALPSTVQLVLDNARADTLDATFEALVAMLRGPSCDPVFQSAATSPVVARSARASAVESVPTPVSVVVIAPVLVVAPSSRSALPATKPFIVATSSPVKAEPSTTSIGPVSSVGRARSMWVHVMVPMAIIVSGLAVVMVLIG